MDKKQLRTAMKDILAGTGEDIFLLFSQFASEHVRKHPAYKRSQTLLCYRAMQYEADPSILVKSALKEGKHVAFPYCVDGDNKEMLALEPFDENAFETGAHGIVTPRKDRSKAIQPHELDLVLVPGLAFDEEGGRLGRGGGYYDRFLMKTPAFRMGFCMSFQMVEHVPMDTHDCFMDAVVTNTGCMYSRECS